MLNNLPPGVCWGGGGGRNRLPALVTKQQAVEFPQVLTSMYNYSYGGEHYDRNSIGYFSESVLGQT